MKQALDRLVLIRALDQTGRRSRERLFAAMRRRTAAAKRDMKVVNATAVIWKTRLIVEQTFRKLNAPELLPRSRRACRRRMGSESHRSRSPPMRRLRPEPVSTPIDKTSKLIRGKCPIAARHDRDGHRSIELPVSVRRRCR
jgi:hypothetical protein